ncbi:MAG: M12 family metallo-peptidase [Pseudomonadota bacterium]
MAGNVTTQNRIVFFAIAAGVFQILMGFSALAEQPKTRSVVFSNLPKPGSLEYQYLRDLAGDLGGEALPMSKSEVWSVAPERLDMLLHVADEQGVGMTTLDETFQSLMKPTSPNDGQPKMSGTGRRLTAMASSDAAVTSVTMMTARSPAFIEYALGRGEKPRIGSKRPPEATTDMIEIPISPSKSITARRMYVETTKEGCVWNGLIEGSPLPVNLMWWPDGRMTGAFTYDGKRYLVRHVEGTEHAVIAIDPDKLPPEHAPGSGPFGRPSAEEARNLEDANSGSEYLPEDLAKFLKPGQDGAAAEEADSGTDARETVLSVMFAYTKRAAMHYGDIRKDLLALAIEQTNQSFRSSKINNVRVELTSAVLAEYNDEKGNHFNHLWRMVDRGDGFMEDIHKLRDQAKADIVILVVDSPTGCGLATRVAAYANEAFAVVHHACATATFSVAHEVGHLIGARHDRSLDKSTRPFPYGHGFVHRAQWRTMMSYKKTCEGCPRLPIWSSPAVQIDGQPAGDANTHNARVIAEQAERVSRFR